jgi:hypothetical protein
MMKKSLTWIAAFALLSGCAAQTEPPAAAPLKPAEAARLRQAGAEVLFWSQEQRDANFRKMEQIFPTKTGQGGRPRASAPRGRFDRAGARRCRDRRVRRRPEYCRHDRPPRRPVRLERYARGFGPEQRWTSFSVAKSLTSTLAGAAVKDGHIRSLDDPVVKYVPELKGSGYDGVTVRQVLTMSSGVRWNEDYSDPKSDVAQMFAAPPPPGMDVTVAYLRGLPRAAEPGTKWNYNTAETNLAGVIVSRAVGRPLSAYASEKIWRPYGMEADAFWQVDERGHEIAGCCLSARLRDYARIGQFMLDGGMAGGKGRSAAHLDRRCDQDAADLPGRTRRLRLSMVDDAAGLCRPRHFRPDDLDRSGAADRDRRVTSSRCPVSKSLRSRSRIASATALGGFSLLRSSPGKASCAHVGGGGAGIDDGDAGRGRSSASRRHS